jgi:adenylosuccinate lyase
MLTAISPIDGRYEDKVKELKSYFSEYALIKYRVYVEIKYFIALAQSKLPQLQDLDASQLKNIEDIYNHFDEKNALKIKEIESFTNHDVKAVEYFIKEKFDDLGLSKYKEFIHFGLTSQDINNTAFPLMLKDCIDKVFTPLLINLRNLIDGISKLYQDVPMLAYTHGQPATPTILGKEMKVFVERIDNQLVLMKQIPHTGKFGGATGNFNAHFATYGTVDWHAFGDQFLMDTLGIKRQHYTTQIEHYDNMAAIFQNIGRINTILTDFCRDMWQYISMNYFSQKVIDNEVGSSAMPHKVNPIDFENAEGNLGIATALFQHFSIKLPVSRLQRDLTDSTVLRNIGVPFAHTIIAYKSILKGINKVMLNEQVLVDDLEKNWSVVSEAIQNILRREGFQNPYELLKALTRGKKNINKAIIHEFIDSLEITEVVKNEMKQITPLNYTGRFK